MNVISAPAIIPLERRRRFGLILALTVLAAGVACALAFAVDRNEAARRYPGRAEVSCQVLAPNFSGYKPYCPFTEQPDTSGDWTAPDLAEAHNSLGIALQRLKRSAEAVPHFERAIELEPERPETHYNLGRALQILGRAAAAAA